jgi:hypothetical protein
MISTSSFRESYSEFSNTTTYPDSAVNYWIGIAGVLMSNTRRWGQGSTVAVSPPTTKIDFATECFVAHNLALEQLAQNAGNAGGVPGLTPGILNSKSVGPVSAGYDTSAGIDPTAGHWNYTTYGMRFARLANGVGMGPLQV